jgi:radical SAM superfamily enzyme YgiQ (UPF0313 family)
MNTAPNQKEIILNCMPPFTVGSPSAALSILKAYLCKHGYSVRVIYWNILLHHLENEFTWNKCQNVQGASTLIYAAYLSVKTKNNSLYNEVKAALQTILPVMLNEKDFFDEHIKKYSLKLEQFIDSYLDSIDYENILYFGFSVKDSQWILASVIAEKIKIRDEKLPIVVGEITTSEVAKTFLDNFKQFDFAIRGEYEIPLLELTQFLLNLCDFSKFDIERTSYRENEIVKETTTKKRLYLNLSENELYPVFDDYFYYKNFSEITAPVDYLVVEGSRCCHWNRCHFCYLNKGSKHRQKSVEKISQEIIYMISTFGVFRFRFVENDIVGKDINRFHSLLDELIKIKNEFIDFSIVAAEVITSDLSFNTIKKMAKAGIVLIQIGFESACDNLLKKIDKKNTLASNLNTIKHCVNVGIKVGGANILYNLSEEVEEDIYESIENLRFFRFIMNEKGGFTLRPIIVKANSSSKYFKTIIKKKEYMPRINLYHKAFLNIFDEETKWHLFEYSLNHIDAKWDYFTDMHYHYTNNNYEYKFIQENDKIIYQEFLNNELTEHIEFDKNEPYISILDYCYDKPVSIQELQNLFSKKNKKITDVEILVEAIDSLFAQGLIYRTLDYTEIVSIVNIHKNQF